MTLIPELHEALASAVEARSRPARRLWPIRRVSLLVLGGAVVTGAALAATGVWHPTLGGSDRGHPQVAHTSVPGDQTAAIGVLRRPQTDADRGPQVRAVLRMLARDEINGVHTDGIRLLRQRTDGVTILVPTERVGRHDKGYPSSIRHRVLCVMTASRTAPRTLRSADGRTVRTHGGLIAGQSCGNLSQLRTTGIGGATGGSHGFIYNALVPDGVARVVIRLRQHKTLTAPVHNNLYEVNTGRELPPAWGVRWLDANGHTIDHRRGRG